MLIAPVVVCVEGAPGTQKLIAAGADYARDGGRPLVVLFLCPPGADRSTQRRINRSQAFARQLGAQSIQRSDPDRVAGLMAYLDAHTPTTIVIGQSARPGWYAGWQERARGEIARRFSRVEVRAVDLASFQKNQAWMHQLPEYLVCVMAVALLTAALQLIKSVIAEADIMMAYLANVLVLAYRFSRGPTLCAALASVAAFDYFFVSPFHTFAVDHEKYLISFAVMTIVGFIFSSLSERAKQQLRESAAREKQLAELYSLARSLATIQHSHELIHQAFVNLTAISDGEVGIFRYDGDGLQAVNQASTLELSQISRAAAGQSLECQGEIHEVIGDLNWHYYPVGPATHLILVICTEQALDSSQRHLLDTCLSLVRLAITRTSLAEQARQAQLQVESEQLRNAILSAVSHDLRTPLATIMGLATTLLDREVVVQAEVTRECLDTIYDLSERLSQKVTNLLQMSRTLGGRLKARIELHNPEEFAGCVLATMKHRLEQHRVEIHMDDTWLVAMDPSLMEIVMSNLLDNAVKFSAPQTLIRICGQRLGAHYRLSVEDQGVGLHGSDDQQLFSHFYRVHEEVGGTGLGLAISKSIVEAHGGTILAQNGPLGGAMVTVTLPYTANEFDGVPMQ